MKHNEIYELAVKEWGEDAQIRQLFEEMAELQKAVCKWYRQKRIAKCEIIEEIADVEIMLEQLKVMLNIDDYLVMKKRGEKISYLKRLLGVKKL